MLKNRSINLSTTFPSKLIDLLVNEGDDNLLPNLVFENNNFSVNEGDNNIINK